MSEHLVPSEIQRFLDDSLPSGEAGRFLEHLTSCRRCREAIYPHRRDPDEDEAYEQALDRAFAVALRHDRTLREERQRAVAAAPLSQPDAGDLPEADTVRLSGLPRIEALLAESRAQRHGDPRRMIHLAELAHAAAEDLDPSRYGRGLVADFQALALAELANACRVADDLDRAEGLLERATKLSERGTGDLRLAARIGDLTASLLGSRRRFSPAVQVLARVRVLYEQLGETGLAARAAISQGVYTGLNNEPEKALELLSQGVAHIDEQAEPELVLSAFHNMIGFLADSGRYREARRLLFRTRPHYVESGQRLNLLRMSWLEGRIALGLHELDRAERFLCEAREGFAEAEQLYDAALVSMDLAGVWLAQGRFTEIERMARQTIQVFQKVGVAQEAVAVMSWLWKSCRMRQLNAGFLEGITFYLKELGPRLVRARAARKA